MCSCISIISSFGNIRTDFKIWIFPIPIAYWPGFGILKQDRDGSDSLKTGRPELPRIRHITELLYL